MKLCKFCKYIIYITIYFTILYEHCFIKDFFYKVSAVFRIFT